MRAYRVPRYPGTQVRTVRTGAPRLSRRGHSQTTRGPACGCARGRAHTSATPASRRTGAAQRVGRAVRRIAVATGPAGMCATPPVLLGATAIALAASCGHAVTMPLHSAEWAGFKPAVEMSGEFGNEGGSALDLGGVYASVFVGQQEFHVHVDTGSSMLIIPAAGAQCPTCPPTQRAVRCLRMTLP